jgi:restriction system protein
MQIKYIFFTLIAIFVASMLIGLFTKRKGSHRVRIKQGDQILKKLNEIESDAAKLAYLKKVNPYAFEELLLTALKKHGLKIKRNKRYSGDGGIDGRAKLNGMPIIIQAKRYDGYIAKAHVELFIETCKNNNCIGFFIHTGKTPSSCFELVKGTSVEIISGKRLIELLSKV